MNKALFKEGKVVNVDGKQIVEFNSSTADIEESFLQSYDRTINLLDGYDVKKYPVNTKKSLYYLHYFSDNISEINYFIDTMLSGDDSLIENKNNSSIMLALFCDNPNSIFWDTMNNFIIVLGEDNLKALLFELELKRWSNLHFKNEDFQKIYIEKSATDVYKKVMKK